MCGLSTQICVVSPHKVFLNGVKSKVVRLDRSFRSISAVKTGVLIGLWSFMDNCVSLYSNRSARTVNQSPVTIQSYIILKQLNTIRPNNN